MKIYEKILRDEKSPHNYRGGNIASWKNVELKEISKIF